MGEIFLSGHLSKSQQVLNVCFLRFHKQGCLRCFPRFASSWVLQLFPFTCYSEVSRVMFRGVETKVETPRFWSDDPSRYCGLSHFFRNWRTLMSSNLATVKKCPLIPEDWKYRACDFPELRGRLSVLSRWGCSRAGDDGNECVLRCILSRQADKGNALSLVQMQNRANYFHGEREHWELQIQGVIRNHSVFQVAVSMFIWVVCGRVRRTLEKIKWRWRMKGEGSVRLPTASGV